MYQNGTAKFSAPCKVDVDDDGQVSIWKALLPLATVELMISNGCTTLQVSSCYLPLILFPPQKNFPNLCHLHIFCWWDGLHIWVHNSMSGLFYLLWHINRTTQCQICFRFNNKSFPKKWVIYNNKRLPSCTFNILLPISTCFLGKTLAICYDKLERIVSICSNDFDSERCRAWPCWCRLHQNIVYGRHLVRNSKNNLNILQIMVKLK